MPNRWRVIAFLVCLAVFSLRDASAVAAPKHTTLYLFWGEGCIYCAAEKAFLSRLSERHPELDVYMFEVWHNRQNARLLSRILKKAGIRNPSVPVTIVGKRMWIGYSQTVGGEIESEVARCITEGCPEPDFGRETRAAQDRNPVTVSIPFMGEVDARGMSLPAFTVVLGIMDSFNPCAFFVLFFLLSLLVHARSKGRMLLIGGMFVFFSGLVYFVFMAAWLNVFLVMGELAVITAVAGAVAVAVATINIKDFFALGKGASLSISKSSRQHLFERMRNLLKTASIPSALAGTAVLALAANTYELLCTAGFPMVYTRVLTLHELGAWSYYGYLVLYNVVYVLPLLVIVGAFVFTLGARKLSEWQGRKLKLVSGMMMLLLGLALVFYPSALNSLSVTVGMLGMALMLSWGTVAVTKRRHPEWTRA